MAVRAFRRAHAPPSRSPMYRARPAYFALALALACGSAPPSRHSTPSDAGIQFNLPDAGSACDAAVPPSSAPAPVSTCVPMRQRDFTRDVLPIFGSCSGEICHEFTPSGLKASIGAQAAECCTETALIAAGFPERSYLLAKVRGTMLCGGGRMPLDKEPLGDADIQAISDWICEGAPTE